MDLWWVRFLTFQSSPSTDPLQACLEGVGRACEAWTWTSWPDIHQPLICAVLPIVLMGQWWQNILLCITTGVQLLWTEVLQLWNMIDWVREQRPSTEENCVGNWSSKQPVTSSSSGMQGWVRPFPHQQRLLTHNNWLPAWTSYWRCPCHHSRRQFSKR